MRQTYIPAWKDDKGNRFIVIAKNHLFDSQDEATKFQLERFIDYILFGWVIDGVFETAIDEETGEAWFPYVPGTGAYGSPVAIIDGPVYMDAVKAGDHTSD